MLKNEILIKIDQKKLQFQMKKKTNISVKLLQFLQFKYEFIGSSFHM